MLQRSRWALPGDSAPLVLCAGGAWIVACTLDEIVDELRRIGAPLS